MGVDSEEIQKELQKSAAIEGQYLKTFINRIINCLEYWRIALGWKIMFTIQMIGRHVGRTFMRLWLAINVKVRTLMMMLRMQLQELQKRLLKQMTLSLLLIRR